jgi:sugar lactone lactonase YvrE
MLSKLVKLLPALIALFAFYLVVWPIPISPQPWTAPEAPGYRGPHARNQRLAQLTLVSVAPEVGPEHITFGPDGKLYTGALSGAVLRMKPDGSAREVLANTGGRPLGMAFDAAGRLIVADALRGLLAVTPEGRVDVLTDTAAVEPILYADAVAIASDGRIVFTDASHRFSPRKHGTFDAALLDIMEHSCTGRVLEYDPVTRATRILIARLCFPNGVVLTPDEQHLIVAETGAYRVWKFRRNVEGLDARAPDLAAADGTVLLDNLPGFPDNVTRGEDGRYWTGLTKPRSAAIDGLADNPGLRAVTLRLPKVFWPVPPSYGHVMAFDEEGRVLLDLQDPDGKLPETSGVTEHAGRLYVQSLHSGAFGVMDLPSPSAPRPAP